MTGEGDHGDGTEGSRNGTDGTVCPFCAVGCRLDRDTGNGAERVTGREGPANPDGRLCEQGLHAFDASTDEHRLTRPLVRPDGDLEPVSWERALDRAVSGFERVHERRGVDALAFLGAPRCPTETNYALGKLARTLGTNNVDNRARGCHVAASRTLESRLGWGATTNSLDDVGGADVFLVVGANPAARQPVAFDSVVRPAVNRGATLVHVDPHRNETTRLADDHLAPRPGTDALVVSLLAALVVESGGVDRAFVEQRTTGFERWRASLRERDLATDAATADIDRDTVATVAEALAAADGVAVATGTGGDDSETADALVNLLLATGSLGRPGCGFVVLRGLANEQGAVDAGCVPDRLPGHRPVTDGSARERLADEWGQPVPETPGKTEDELVDGFGDDIGAALVVGENPAVSKRDADALAAGLDALDTLVVTELSPSETTAHADVVLPAAAGVERAGTVTNLDRQVQRLRPPATPPGDARTDFEIVCALGRRLVGDGFDFGGPNEAFAEFTRVAPPYAGLSYEALETGSHRWPVSPGPDRAGGDPFLYADGFDTSDGRAAFVTVTPGEPALVDGLRLVTGDRAGSFGRDGAVDGSVTVHPVDARARDLADGDRVVVSAGDATVETTATVSDAIRRGTVHLHASVADPLVRRGDGRPVELRPV